jgi:hypothetical protein
MTGMGATPADSAASAPSRSNDLAAEFDPKQTFATDLSVYRTASLTLIERHFLS